MTDMTDSKQRTAEFGLEMAMQNAVAHIVSIALGEFVQAILNRNPPDLDAVISKLENVKFGTETGLDLLTKHMESTNRLKCPLLATESVSSDEPSPDTVRTKKPRKKKSSTK